MDTNDNLLIWGGVSQDLRIKAGVATLVDKLYLKIVQGYKYTNERSTMVDFKTNGRRLTVIEFYAPEDGKKPEKQKFYDDFQNECNYINKNNLIILAGDLNAKIRKTSINKMIENYREAIRDETCLEFTTFDNLK